MLIELGKWTVALHPLHWKFGKNTSSWFHETLWYFGPVWVTYG